MNKNSVLRLLFLTSWMAAAGFAQETPTQTSNSASTASSDILPLLAQLNAVPDALAIPAIADLNMEVPAEPNAWVLRIVSGGGFTGQYRGFVVASQGTVRCTMEIQCRGILSASELGSLSALLSETVLSKWPQANASTSSPMSICNDCIRVWLELRHREKDGIEKLYAITWNDVSKSSIPLEVRQIYETAVSFRR